MKFIIEAAMLLVFTQERVRLFLQNHYDAF